MDYSVERAGHDGFHLHPGSTCLLGCQYNLVAVVMVVASLSGMLFCLFFMVVVMVVALASAGSHADGEYEQR